MAIVLAIAATAASAKDAPDRSKDLDAVLAAFPAGMTAEQIDAVLAVTDDAKIRDALRTRLLAEMAARQAGPAAPDYGNLLDLYSRRLSAVAATYPRLPQDIANAFRTPAGGDGASGALRLVGALLLVLLCGIGAMLAVRRLLAERRRRATRRFSRCLT